MAAIAAFKVRTGLSVWQAGRLAPLGCQPLRRDTSTDVLVVGAGISGALVTESLTEAGLAIVVIDKGRPVAGSTTASTALLQYEIDTPLTELSTHIGLDRARRIWRRSRLALDALRERTRRLGIEAHCQNRDSLYLEGDQLNRGALEEEANARRSAGFEVVMLSRRQVQDRHSPSPSSPRAETTGLRHAPLRWRVSPPASGAWSDPHRRDRRSFRDSSRSRFVRQSGLP